MRLAPLVFRAALAFLPLPASAHAQTWRHTADGLGSTARVLIVGTHPEDEDNALIAWLSLGRRVETAYLSLTRGESGPNVTGQERQAALGAVRTAELLAERRRDGARQYFTRAYDFGFARSDSVVDAGWPHDSLLADVVAVIRAFRPQVVVSLYADSGERNVMHRAAARLAREAFIASSDTVLVPSSRTSRLAPWTALRLFTRVDSAMPGVMSVDVGEFDRTTGRSFAELGAEIRRLQRSQPPPPAPALGHVWRFLRLDRGGTDDANGLFAAPDTAWSRFRGVMPASVEPLLDSVRAALASARALANGASTDSLAVAFARVARRALDARAAFVCPEISGVPTCPGPLGDLAASLGTVRLRATRAFLSTSGIVVDGTVARELVAAGDSVATTVKVFNGGSRAVTIRQLRVSSGSGLSVLVRDSTSSRTVAPDSVAEWSTSVRVNQNTLNWWQKNGLVEGLWIHDFLTLRPNAVVSQLISGEDRIATSDIAATVAIDGIELPIIEGPLVYRDPGMVRGDDRHPLAGITSVSVLFERIAEYERAGLPIDRLLRVYVASMRSSTDTLTLSLTVPARMTLDSATRVVIVPPFGERNVFFRLRGTLKPGTGGIEAVAQRVQSASARPGAAVTMSVGGYKYGVVPRDYPHIPSQRFYRESKQRLEVVDLRVPPRLRVAYIKGSEDIQTQLGQLRLNVQVLDPSLLSVVDLSVFSSVLVGAGALANDALAGAVPSVLSFVRGGGTVVVLPGGDEVARSGLFPYPITFDSVPDRVNESDAAVRFVDARAQVLTWPNAITAADFEGWSGERARSLPAALDPRYRPVLAVHDAGQPPTSAALVVAQVGKGAIVYTPLALDRQIATVNPGAARLFVNLLAAGLRPAGRD